MATATLDILIDSSSVPNATRQLQQLEKQGKSTESSVGGMKGAMQNLSWQIQDVAVQAQMGTSNLTILAQQGPQIASVFGPAGAAAGALIGIGALIASVGSSSVDTKMSLDDLIKGIDDLGSSQLQYQELLARESAEQARLDNQRIQSTTQLGYYQSLVDKGISLSESQNKTYLELRSTIEANNETINKFNLLTDEMQRKQDGVTKSSKELAASLNETLSAISMQTEMLGKSAAMQDAMSEAQRLGISLETEQGQAILAATQAYHAKKDAITAADQEAKKAEQTAIRVEAQAKREAEAEQKKYELKARQADEWLYQVQAYQLSESQMVDRWYSEQLVKLQEYNDLRPDMAQQANEALIALEEEKARRLMEIDTKVTEHNKAEIEKQRQAQMQAGNLMIQQTQLTTGLISDMLQGSGAENSSAMQMMLAAQKALAIPSIMVSTEQAAAAAMAQESIMGGLLAGTTAANIIRAQGMISVGIVAGQAIGNFAGAFDKGGNIPRGQFGIVGERGPEIVQGPVNVTSRKKTAALAASAASGGSGGGGANQYVTINQSINGSGDEALAKATKEAVKQALVETQRDFATNGPIRRTAGI